MSTKEQAQNYSLDSQEAICREYCQRHKIAVEEVFVERGESAKTADRTELRRLLVYCEKHKAQISTLVVYKIDRLARNTHDHLTIKLMLGRLGISLRSCTELVGDSAMGKFTETMLAGMAQFDNDVRAERTRLGMRSAAESGRWMFKPPLGYIKGPQGGTSLVPDSDRASLVREAFELYASTRGTSRAI